MSDRCDRCGRFIGEDCSEGVDWSAGVQQDGDVAWTGKFYCANGKGCNRSEGDTPSFLLAAGPGSNPERPETTRNDREDPGTSTVRAGRAPVQAVQASCPDSGPESEGE